MSENIDDIDEKRDLISAVDFKELRDKLTAGQVLQLEKRDIIVVRYDDDAVPPDQLADFMKHLRAIFGEHLPDDTGIRLMLVPRSLEFAVIRPPRE